MRVFQVNSHYGVSGAGKMVSCIHRELGRRGHESMVAYGRGKKTRDAGVYRIGSKLEVALEGLATRVVGIHGFTSWKATTDLVKEIDRFGPDVIHLHGLHGYYLNIEILFNYINRKEIPCVWTFHDCMAFTGNCGYSFECEKWKSGCGTCPAVREYPTSLWFDRTGWMWRKKKQLFTKGDNLAVVSPTRWMTNDARQSFFGRYECVTVNNGIDTEEVFFDRGRTACREKHGFLPDEKIVLGVAWGFDNPRKGVKHLIELARNLADVPVKVILIGWSPKDRELISGLDNVVPIPFTNDQSVLAEYYSLADVFCLPSYSESFGLVAVEAMACGTPVVGFDAGGIPEVLEDRRGIVVGVGNQIEFEAAVMSIISGDGEVGSRQEIIERTKQKNSVRAMVDSYVDVYGRLVRQVESRAV